MNRRNLLYSRQSCLVQFGLLFFWLLSLQPSATFFSTNVLMALAGGCFLSANCARAHTLSGWRSWVILAVSVLFSGAVILANYDIFLDFSRPATLLSLPFVFLGGLSLAWNTLLYLTCRFPEVLPERTLTDRRHGTAVFFASSAAIAAVYLLALFFAEYPGNLTDDSINQMKQVVSGNYANHHPVFHTICIELCVNLGLALFGNYNDAVALYSAVQLLFLAACFAYAVATLYQAGMPRLLVIGALLVYMLAPYHISYSVTMWKDVPFGGAAAVLVASVYRILKGIGKNQKLNYAIAAFGSLAFCLWRTNGWLALGASFVLCFAFLRRDQKKLLLLWAAALVIGWFLKGPMLNLMNIPQPDTVESLSIPVQQIARVIHDGRELTEEEAALLGRIMDLEEVPELYLWYLSDPIKDEIRSKDVEYFNENLGQYLKLWVQLGLKNPGTYVKAWVDQTKGYWNSGYRHYVTISYLPEDFLGLYKPMENTAFYEGLMQYFYSGHNVPFLEFTVSIGLHVWVLAFLFFACALQGRREAILSVPILMVILTLLVATPVYSEFRYAYTVFTTLPLILPVSLCHAHPADL